MKKLVLAAAAAVVCLLAVSCGNQSNNKSSNKDNNALEQLVDEIEANSEGGIVGYTGDAGAALKTLDDSNYAAIVKTIYGVNIKPADSWKLYSAKSPNKVNNANIMFTNEGEIDETAVKNDFVEQLLNITEDGVYTIDLDFDTLKLSKGDKIESFEDYLEKAPGKSLYYVYGGKGIQASASTRSSATSTVEYSFTLTTIN